GHGPRARASASPAAASKKTADTHAMPNPVAPASAHPRSEAPRFSRPRATQPRSPHSVTWRRPIDMVAPSCSPLHQRGKKVPEPTSTAAARAMAAPKRRRSRPGLFIRGAIVSTSRPNPMAAAGQFSLDPPARRRQGCPPLMSRKRLTFLTAVAAAAAIGGMVMVARAEERRTETAAASATPRTDRGAALRAALSYYRDLAEWRIRAQLAPSAASGLERSLEVAAAIVTVRPGDALSAALSDDAPVLRSRPVPGHANSNFGVRKNPFNHRGRERHAGIDLSASRGTPVHAAGAGMVVRAERGGGYGRVVYVDHGGGLETRYAHLQKILVKE